MKKIIFLFVIVSLISFSCNNPKDKGSTDSNDQEIPVNPENVVLVDMDVTGMTCTGCENTIKSGVSELHGVVEVEADYKEGKTMVKVDTSLVSVDEISDKIASKGYAVMHSQIEPAN